MIRRWLPLLVIFFLLYSKIVYSHDYYAFSCKPSQEPQKQRPDAIKEAPPQNPQQPSELIEPQTSKEIKKVSPCKSTKYRVVANFKIRKDAEKFAKELRENSCIAIVKISTTKDKKKIYSVYAKKSDVKSKKGISTVVSRVMDKTDIIPEAKEEDDTNQIISSSEKIIKDTSPVEPSINKPVFKENIPTEQKKIIQPDKPIVVTQKETIPEITPAEEIPIGREKPSWDIFGRRSGFLHPFISVTEYYTDNVFNANNNKESDFVTIISPGIWISIPHIYEKLLMIETSNISPGGYTLSRYKPEYFRRYQTYIFYNADIEKFSKFSGEDTVNHRFEGFFQYNLKGGISLEVVDQYMDSHDIRGTGISQELDKYKTNLFHGIGIYDVSERFRLRFDYSRFHVNYDEDRNDFRDRDDNSIYGYIFYKIQPKTSFFIEYEYLNIDYKKEYILNSIEHHYFGGIQWEATAKSKGSIKAGYGIKDFSYDDEESREFILELQVDYKFTPKTSLLLRALRRTNETNIATTDFILSNKLEAEYIQRVTGKITADIKLIYENDTYNGALTFSGETKEREDNYFYGIFSLQYDFKEWLKTNIGYIYARRDSNFSDFDYTANSIFFRITGAL